MILLLLGCPASDDVSSVDWKIAPADVGDALVSGSSFDPTDGDAIGAAFSDLVPGFAEGMPAWEVPAAVWAIAMGDLVADDGACPYAALAGDETEYRSDCRSQDGYEWSGSAWRRAWEEDGVAREHFRFDVDVVGDVEGADFDALGLHGEVERATDGDVEHIDVNLAVGLTGYFEARNMGDDRRVSTWASWQVSGSVEGDGSGATLSTVADIGGTGAFPLAGRLELADSCPVEPSGELAMGDDTRASFAAEDCDACAQIEGSTGSVAACAR